MPLKLDPGITLALVILHYQPVPAHQIAFDCVKLVAVAAVPFINDPLTVEVDPNAVIGAGLKAIASVGKI